MQVLDGTFSVYVTPVKIKLLTEEEAELALKINESRNLTSHIYREEIAEQLIQVIPGYYQLMNSIAKKL